MNENTSIPRIAVDFSLIQNNLANYTAALNAWIAISKAYDTQPSVIASNAQINAFLAGATAALANMQNIMKGA